MENNNEREATFNPKVEELVLQSASGVSIRTRRSSLLIGPVTQSLSRTGTGIDCRNSACGGFDAVFSRTENECQYQ